MFETDYIVSVTLFLGFRMRQDVPRYLRTIVTDLMESGRIHRQYQRYSITPNREVGDFRFVIVEEKLVNAQQLPSFERFVLQTKEHIKRITATPIRWFGLQFSEVTIERVPLILSEVSGLAISERNNSRALEEKYTDNL